MQEINETESKFYAPPQSPIAIQPGDTGFKLVGKNYNRFIWTFKDWEKKKKKIIDPDANWELSAKPITAKEWQKKQKGLFL